MIFNVHAAKTSLSKLIERAENGEEVIIARAGKPAVRLTPVVVEKAREGGSWLGSMKGNLRCSPGAFEPDEELGRLMEEGPIFPSDDQTL